MGFSTSSRRSFDGKFLVCNSVLRLIPTATPNEQFAPFKGMYYHPLFKKDHPELCKRIHCVPTLLSDGVLNPFDNAAGHTTIFDKKGRPIDLGSNESDLHGKSPLSPYQRGMLSAATVNQCMPNPQIPQGIGSSSSVRARLLDQALRQNMPPSQHQNFMNSVMPGSNSVMGQNLMNDPSFLLNNAGRMNNMLQNQMSLLQQPTLPQAFSRNPPMSHLDILNSASNRAMPPTYDMSLNNRPNMIPSSMELMARAEEERRLLQQNSNGAAAVSNRIRELDTLLAASASRRGGPGCTGEQRF